MLEDEWVEAEVLGPEIQSFHLLCNERKLTGVSNAIRAIILGQRGACLSGLEVAMPMNVSAATRPPILHTDQCISTKGKDAVPVPAENDLGFTSSTTRSMSDFTLNSKRRKPICKLLNRCFL